VPYPARYRQDALPAGFVVASALDLARYALALSGYQIWSGWALLRSCSARHRPVLSRAALCEVGLVH